MAQLVRNPPTMWETWVQSRGWDEPLEGTATHPSILAWRTLRTIADGVERVRHTAVTFTSLAHMRFCVAL